MKTETTEEIQVSRTVFIWTCDKCGSQSKGPKDELPPKWAEYFTKEYRDSEGYAGLSGHLCRDCVPLER